MKQYYFVFNDPRQTKRGNINSHKDRVLQVSYCEYKEKQYTSNRMIGEQRIYGFYQQYIIDTVNRWDHLPPECIVVTEGNPVLYKSGKGRMDNFIYCHSRRKWMSEDSFGESRVDSNRRNICDEAYDESYFTCDRCDNVIHNDDYGEDGFCQGCCDSSSCDDDVEGDDRILDYGDDYDATLIIPKYLEHTASESIYMDSGIASFHESFPHETPFGVELEFNYKDDDISSMINFTEKPESIVGIWKHDGSLESGGAEFITMPHTRASFREKSLRKLLKEIHDRGGQGYESGECGIHVHVDRSRLDAVKGKKITNKVLWDIVTLNTDFLRAFSKRKDKAIEGFCRLPNIDGESDTWWGARYRAVNTTNERTIEFRIFRGTTEYRRTLASIHLCLLIHDYALYVLRYTTANYSIRQYLEDNKDLYAFLYKYIVSEDLIGVLSKEAPVSRWVPTRQPNLEFYKDIVEENRIYVTNSPDGTMTAGLDLAYRRGPSGNNGLIGDEVERPTWNRLSTDNI